MNASNAKVSIQNSVLQVAYFSSVQEILEEVDGYKSAAGLSPLVTQLVRYMDPSTASNISSRTKVLQQVSQYTM